LEGIAEFNFRHTSEVSVLIGRTLTPEIVAVEATFDAGQTVRDRVDKGVFALAAEDAFNVCEMRLLDTKGSVIGRTQLMGRIVDEPDRDGAPVCKPYE
jgi:hypothetical protein